ncbi:autotransporter adhesin BpaC-like [Physella acuta]|uniref:autotransporter adhesin BpaC-like n=1 Tax=Physella acuta TaxID=109671 RepID=UPI0027DDF7E4|nr:autotransporter adhesin BpaC-like [Physella acuta]
MLQTSPQNVSFGLQAQINTYMPLAFKLSSADIFSQTLQKMSVIPLQSPEMIGNLLSGTGVPLSATGLMGTYTVPGDLVLSGTNSVLSGTNSVLSGTNSVLSGTNSVLSGTNSVLSGTNSVLSGTNSVLSGTNSVLSGTNSVLSGMRLSGILHVCLARVISSSKPVAMLSSL